MHKKPFKAKVKDFLVNIGLILGILIFIACVVAYFINAHIDNNEHPTYNPIHILRDGILRAINEPPWD